MQQCESSTRRPSIELSNDFKEVTNRDAELRMKVALENLVAKASPERKDLLETEFKGFRGLFKRYLSEASSEIDWEKIKHVDEEIKLYANLPDINYDLIKEYLNKIVIIKLNGGLGTSMGCTGPKSLISVRSDLTFLDLTILQIEDLNKKYGCDIPLVLMNSFNTQDDTLQVVKKYTNINVCIESFQQSMYPRIHRESLVPIAKSVHFESEDIKHNESTGESNDEAWYPPGHGDIYRSFLNSGLLDKYINQGKRFAFISNIDNMGATIDIKILSFLLESLKTDKSPEFVMEVTDKTRADVKGGTLVKYEDKLRLLEIAQVPKDRKEEFTSVRKFRIFNTNNLWINLDAIKRVILEDKLQMEVIVNPKTLADGRNIIQLEEASGSAIKCFNNAIGVNVPRSRFLPVKQCADLLLVMSNLYELSKGCLIMSSKRGFPSVPLVKLGTQFTKVKDFLNRFSSIPNMLELDHLTVSGDVTFGKDVVLKGTVIIIANHGERIDIPSGSVLDNKIISGNLRILDH